MNRDKGRKMPRDMLIYTCSGGMLTTGNGLHQVHTNAGGGGRIKEQLPTFQKHDSLYLSAEWFCDLVKTTV